MSYLVRLLTVVVLMMCMILTNGGDLAARQSGDDFELGIVVANCEREPTSFPFQGGDCAPAEGTVIVVTTLEGALVGTCIAKATEPTAIIGFCSILVPLGGSVIVSEEESTIPAGYAPTNNPQTFDVPTGPSVDVDGGPIFLNLPTENAAIATDNPIDIATKVEFLNEPNWWIVPRAPGYGNTEDGDLYFGAMVENPTSSIIRVGVSFRAYEDDGTPFPGCQMSGGEGPGVTTTIAPYETASITCSRTIVPRTLDGL